jgi:hypothetical protein
VIEKGFQVRQLKAGGGDRARDASDANADRVKRGRLLMLTRKHSERLRSYDCRWTISRFHEHIRRVALNVHLRGKVSNAQPTV